jgi:hypothetical protein
VRSAELPILSNEPTEEPEPLSGEHLSKLTLLRKIYRVLLNAGAEALRRDAELDADPDQAISPAQLNSQIQARRG